MNRFSATVAPAAASGLAPFAGTWEKSHAAHLLRRAVMGPKRQEIVDAAAAGLDATLDQLFSPPVLPPPPINTFFKDDPNVPVGETWVNSPHVEGIDVGKYRWPTLRGWYMHHLIDAPCTIMEKLTIFWINHFGMADVGEHRAQYQYVQLFREFGAGSFQQLIERITVHPAMLRFLNGEYSNKWNPNENYARELLELFTIQKGVQVAPGDYTHYTEDDIKVIARIMTGWRNLGMWTQADEPVMSYFYEEWHDDENVPYNPSTEPKTLSYRFNNVTIASNGADEYKDLINVIFQQEEVSRAICREFYRFFVHYDIDATVESTVIEPLAAYMRDNGYSVEMTLRNLFASQHFFDMSVRGPSIKNPYEFFLSIMRPLDGFAHENLSIVNNPDSSRMQTIYDIGNAMHWFGDASDMDFLYPPTVAGWKAYYQAPNYYRNWIGSSTLQERRKLVQDLTNRGRWFRIDGGDYEPIPMAWLAFIEKIPGAIDVNEVVQECIDTFLPRNLHPDQFDALKAQLLQGQADQEWTVQWASYLSSPNNPDISGPLTNNIKSFFNAMFSMAEFNLQ